MTAMKWWIGGIGVPAVLLLAGGLATSCGQTGSSSESDDETVGTAAGALVPENGEVCVSIRRGSGTAADTWIAAGDQNTNNGAAATLTTGGLLVGSSLFQFDVSAIPSSATVTRGFLRVSQTYAGNAPVDAYMVTAPWSEGSATYANFGNAFTPTPFTSLVLGTGPIPPLYFDMVAPLQAWIDGTATNNGVLLKQGSSGQRIVRSSEDASSANRPVLQFCYLDLCSGVTCAASDSCHVAGTCDPQTGLCSNPVVANGTSCNDSNVCTTGDVCMNGVCTGTPVTQPGPGPAGNAGSLGAFPDPIGVTATKNQILITGYCDFPNHVYYMDDFGNYSVYATIPTPNDGCVEEYLSTSPGLGGFTANDTFVTHGQQIYRIDGAHNASLFATIPTLGSTHTGIGFDHTGLFGFDMIITGNAGHVYRVNSAGVATLIANVGTGIEGPDVAPLTFAPYGGHIIVAAETANAVYAIGPAPNYTVSFVLSWPAAESIHVIPAHPCSYGSTGSAFFSAIYPSFIADYPTGNFTGFANDILVTSENGGIGRMHSNGSSISVTSFYGNIGQHEGSTFVDCSVPSSCNDLCTGVVCTALDACHDVGVCDPNTGTCTNPPKAVGSACDDGNACTTGETCQALPCNPGGSIVWLGHDGQPFTKLAASDGALLQTLSIGGTGAAFDGTKLYFGGFSNTIFVRQPNGTTPIAQFGTQQFGSPTEDITWDTVRQRIWRVDHSPPTLVRINPATQLVDAHYALSTSASNNAIIPRGALGVAYDTLRDVLYVSFCRAGCSSSTIGQVITVNPNTGAETGTLYYTGGFMTGGLAFDSLTDTLWVGSNNGIHHMTRTGVDLNVIPNPAPGFPDGAEYIPVCGAQQVQCIGTPVCGP